MLKISGFYKKQILFFALIVFACFPFFSALAVETPVLSQATVIVDNGQRTLTVSGTASNETSVLVYVNDSFLGETAVLGGKFVFRTGANNISSNASIVVAAREQETQEMSGLSSSKRISETVKIKTPATKPQTTTKKETEPEVVEEDASEDQNTSTENNSNIEDEATQGEISDEAAQEELPVVKGIESEFDENPTEEEKTLEEILASNLDNLDSTTTGIVNEQNEEIGKIQLNVLVFLIFLSAVIAWIVWVNRELIKEKEAEENKQIKD